MLWVKLTSHFDTPIYLNVANISSIMKAALGSYIGYNHSSNGNTLQVKETPEEILELLKETP